MMRTRAGVEKAEVEKAEVEKAEVEEAENAEDEGAQRAREHAQRVSLGELIRDTEAEGPGRRAALWVRGCPLRCPGCCNPELLEFDAPGPDAPTVGALLETLSRGGEEGVSLLGGEPFAHAETLAPLAEGLRAAGKSVMIYSGFTLRQLRRRAAEEPFTARLLSACDLLVDGPYLEAQRSEERRWIGSRNQGLHFLSGFYDPADPRFRERNTVELRLDGERLLVNGWPLEGVELLRRRES